MIRVGLVGFGMAGRVFHAPLISSVEGLELTAVVERHTNQAAERYPGITTYRSLDELLAEPSIDLVVVATPSGTHYDVARQALEADRAVVVDKPMAVTAEQIRDLMGLAGRKGSLLMPFHNRRWDGDFLTVKKLLSEGFLGRLVHLESRIDRWRPGATRVLWKEDATAGGGLLLDLGTHLMDQALALFGKPLGVSAEVQRERDGEGAEDAFNLRLRYEKYGVTLGANVLSSPAARRFRLRGTKGNFIKKSVDPQEAALNKVTRITDPGWGKEPAADWGMLHVDVDGGMVTRPLTTLVGDYRGYYAAVRDAVLGNAPAPVTAVDAWRAAQLLEWAVQSAKTRCEVVCDWTGEPT